MNGKCVFLGTKEKIEEVYGEKLLNEMQDKIGTDKTAVFDIDSIKSSNGALNGVSAVFGTWGMPALTEEEIKEFLPDLKYVFYAAGSVKPFAGGYFNANIRIFSAASANAVPVAQVTSAEITLANKGFFQHIMNMKLKNDETARNQVNSFPGNIGAKIGIIGAGAIGKQVIKMLSAEDNEIYIYDPFLPKETADKLGAKLKSLEFIFSECDTISNHLANNEHTKGILNYSLFSKMKPNSVFINTGRGAQVVEADLIRALSEDKSRAAVLDVTDPEPPEIDSPFYEMPNIFLTPHFAGSCGNEPRRMARYMFEEYLRIKGGEKPLYEVTPQMLKTMA